MKQVGLILWTFHQDIYPRHAGAGVPHSRDLGLCLTGLHAASQPGLLSSSSGAFIRPTCGSHIETRGIAYRGPSGLHAEGPLSI